MAAVDLFIGSIVAQAYRLLSELLHPESTRTRQAGRLRYFATSQNDQIIAMHNFDAPEFA